MTQRITFSGEIIIRIAAGPELVVSGRQEVNIGDPAFPLTVVAQYPDGTTGQFSSLEFTSGDVGVATVDDQGVVTPVNVGEVMITVSGTL